jgi:hypothetical protein
MRGCGDERAALRSAPARRAAPAPGESRGRASIPRAGPGRTVASCTSTAIASSVRCRTPRTSCRRPCWPPGAGLTASRVARRCGPGFTGSPRTAASTRCAIAGGGCRSCRRRRGPGPARPHPSRRADLARALPRRSRGGGRPLARAGGALCGARGDRTGLRRRPAAAPAPPARRARAARRARLPRERGGGDAWRHRSLGHQRAPQGTVGARHRPARRAARRDNLAELTRGARAGVALHRCLRGGRRAGRRGPAHRGRMADDAARAARVPGAGRDRPLPRDGPRRRAARPVPARADTRQRAAGFRRLPARPPYCRSRTPTA